MVDLDTQEVIENYQDDYVSLLLEPFTDSAGVSMQDLEDVCREFAKSGINLMEKPPKLSSCYYYPALENGKFCFKKHFRDRNTDDSISE